MHFVIYVTGKSFTTAKELLQAVINGQVKGALLEANEASTLLDFISANGLRVIKQIETNKGIGMLLSGEMTTLHADIRTYVQNNQDMISKLLKNGTMELEVSVLKHYHNLYLPFFLSTILFNYHFAYLPFCLSTI